MKLTFIAAAVCTLVLTGFTSCRESKAFNFDEHGPLAFLDFLRNESASSAFVTIDSPKRNWIRREHLKELFGLLDSNDRCSAVIRRESSFLPRESTIGMEAAFMIEGFRRGEYPPELHAGMLHEGIKNELREWWRAQGAH